VDLWLNILTFVTGANLVFSGLSVAIAGYAGWRYVFVPWKIMRTDIKALADAVAQIKEEMGLRRAMSLSDEEQAMIERRARTRQLWSGPGAPTSPTIQAPAR
jgi:hypothetical protein